VVPEEKRGEGGCSKLLPERDDIFSFTWAKHEKGKGGPAENRKWGGVVPSQGEKKSSGWRGCREGKTKRAIVELL